MSSQGVNCEVQVRRQVWESLASMLRVYAHAASLNAVDEYLVTNTSEEASVKHRDSALHLRFTPETGEGCWRHNAVIFSACSSNDHRGSASGDGNASAGGLQGGAWVYRFFQ